MYPKHLGFGKARFSNLYADFAGIAQSGVGEQAEQVENRDVFEALAGPAPPDQQIPFIENICRDDRCDRLGEAVERPFELRFGRHPHKTLRNFAILEKHESRDALNAVLLGHGRIVIDIDLPDLDSARILLGQLLDQGSDLPTWTTPRRPKIHQHSAGRIQHFILEIVIGKFDSVLSHARCSLRKFGVIGAMYCYADFRFPPAAVNS